MGRAQVYFAVALVALTAAVAIAFAAAWDHSHPGLSTHEQWVSDWYCVNFGERCDDAKPWEARWHRREPVYYGGVSVSLAVAAVLGLGLAGTRLDRRRARSAAARDPR